jgi:hypothetical protein
MSQLAFVRVLVIATLWTPGLASVSEAAETVSYAVCRGPFAISQPIKLPERLLILFWPGNLYLRPYEDIRRSRAS